MYPFPFSPAPLAVSQGSRVLLTMKKNTFITIKMSLQVINICQYVHGYNGIYMVKLIQYYMVII